MVAKFWKCCVNDKHVAMQMPISGFPQTHRCACFLCLVTKAYRPMGVCGEEIV